MITIKASSKVNKGFITINMSKLQSYEVEVTETALQIRPNCCSGKAHVDLPLYKNKVVDTVISASQIGIDETSYSLPTNVIKQLNTLSRCGLTKEEIQRSEMQEVLSKWREEIIFS